MIEPTYLKGLFLRQDGTVEPATFTPDPSGWLGPEPALQVMNDPTGHNFTFSVFLRSRLEQMYVSARTLMEMAGLPSSALAAVQTLSWGHKGEGWVQFVIGMKESQRLPPVRGVEGLAVRGRHFARGSRPPEPAKPKKAARKARPAPAASPLLEKLIRRAR